MGKRRISEKAEFALARTLTGSTQVDRVCAARAIIEAQGNTSRAESLALAGFMAIFHPEVPEDRVRDMCRDVRERRR